MDDERSPADRAADFTRQLNEDQVSRQLRENIWGSADLVDFKNLKFDEAGSGRGPKITIGSVALVAGCGALLGLLLGRDEKILTAIVFALIAGGTVALAKISIRLLGWGVRSSGRAVFGLDSALRGLPRCIVAGGLVGSIAGAALAMWVGGVDLMEGVSVLGPMGALGGGLARLVDFTIRRSS